MGRAYLDSCEEGGHVEIFTEAITRDRDTQNIIRHFKRHEKLIPEPFSDDQPINGKIRLRKDSGEIFGYLSQDISQKVISEIEAGKKVKIEIAKVDGGGRFAKKPVRWQLKVTFQ